VSVLGCCLMLGFFWIQAPLNDQKKVEENRVVSSPIVEDLENQAEVLPSDMSEQEFKAVIYYLNPELGKLVPVVRDLLPTPSDENRLKQVVEWLSMDPESEELQRIWPDIILLRDVFIIENQTIVIDFNSGALANYNAGIQLEGQLLYSLVNSILDSFPWYANVWVLIDGHVAETFLGHIDIEKKLLRNASLLAELEETEAETAEQDP